METIEQVQARLSSIRAAKSEGVLSVRHPDGTSITYQSMDALNREEVRLEAKLDRLQRKRRARTVRLYQRGTGL